MWFNNVETKPGVGYPRGWEDEDHYHGGWHLNDKGHLELVAGNKLNKIALGKIFYNPDMPELNDYYEPWTYDYQTLFSPAKKHQPVARAKSQITGQRMDLKWPNWMMILPVPQKPCKKIPISRKLKPRSKPISKMPS
ncbi:respiratory nitrate reductase beta chain [Agrilactobacillus composti DSM 18527 = JCM 14202]|nr:respiratory nitrate reductase beta chain [Agrilactobacillus composti DSM 18527 = JCM 14202]